MPSLWKAFSSSNSNNNPPLKGKSKSSNDIYKNTANHQEQKRKLTRVRKLRHASDDELGLKSTALDAGPQSLPVSPVSSSSYGLGAKTPRHICGEHWSKSAVPQPLPRPEMNYQQTQTDCSYGPAASSSVTRNHSHQVIGKTTDDIINKSNPYPTYLRRGFPQELKIDNDFHLNFPTRSAPGSGFTSPVLSPQRYSTVDLLHPSSNLEFSNSDRIFKSYQISPVHSPTQQSPTKHGTSRGVSVHWHNKSLPGDINSANVHPLPRPPVVSRPSPTIRHNFDKSDVSSSVKGQWQRGRPIGRGTFGSVYIATHRYSNETGATCAVKEVEMIPDDPKCEECVKQLEQEIKLLRELKHRNIVQYYGCETIEDRFCIYLEYVHPGSVNKYVREHCGAMTESIVRNFTRHILSGLAYLHSTNTIHRDIKGANLLVDASGVVKLADFGLAKHLNGHDIDLSLKGTPHWMAPEFEQSLVEPNANLMRLLQAVMRKDAYPDLAYGVDIWSVGCTVIEMLTGKPPWSEFTWVQAMFNVLNRSPRIPETLCAEGKDFLQQCFQRRPEDRPSAAKLLEHPFIRSSRDPIVAAGFVQEFSGMKLHAVESTSDWTRRNKDIMPMSSINKIQQGKLPLLNGEMSRQSCPESSDSGPASHNSPRSSLEALPRVSSPEVNRCSNSSSPSNVENNLLLRAVNNNVYSFSCKGNLTLLMPKMAERKKQSCNLQQEIN
ncbi:hypothetical protein CASFOL_001008 [Castilleja foliolosa]|uniref:mitogen-activated protein kinase kinase kinase n=1 Tax=Castilleja foliolosa TaxID=1961234 RepID=A0ABD3EN92_9LAMI